MAKLQKRNLGAPDEVRAVGRGRLEVVEMGDAAFGRVTFPPGFRWSEDVKPIVATDYCEVHHVGYTINDVRGVAVHLAARVAAAAGAGEVLVSTDQWPVVRLRHNGGQSW